MKRSPLKSAAIRIGLTAAIPAAFTSIQAAEYTTIGSGTWDNTAVWSGGVAPMTGSTDSVTILHAIMNTGTSVGLPSGSNDWGVASGQTVTIDGGSFAHSQPGWWQRIGDTSEGTVIIKDGEWNYVGNDNTGSGQLQLGLNGGRGVITLGDNTGAAGTAILDLRNKDAFGNANSATIALNVGTNNGSDPSLNSGLITINSDGLLRTDTGSIVRVGWGQGSEGTIQINAGGRAEIGSDSYIADGAYSTATVNIDGAGAILVKEPSTMTIAAEQNSTAHINISNGGELRGVGGDFVIARDGNSTATIVVDGAGSKFVQESGDFRVGYGGNATMTLQNGGSFERVSSNWSWIGQNNGSNGIVRVQEGGTFANADANMRIAQEVGSTGLLEINGGTYTGTSTMAIGYRGTGTFRQTAGSTTTGTVHMSGDNGNSYFYLEDGTFNANGNFFMGGESGASVGTGSNIANAVQTGGTLTATGAFVIGLGANYNAFFDQQGGEVFQTGSDATVGENGNGLMRIGADAVFNSTSGGQFFVGRNAGSHGELYVNGVLNRTVSGSGVRVGDVSSTGSGVLGGVGEINPGSGGVRIGSVGTITGGDLLGVGNLTINGNLSFNAGSYHMDIASDGSADLLTVNGTIDLTSSILDIDWTSDAPTGIQTRYWAMLNDDTDAVTGAFANATGAPVGFTDLFPTADGWITKDGQIFAVFYGADAGSGSLTGGNDVLLVAIPEPGKMLTASLALAALAARRRRKA